MTWSWRDTPDAKTSHDLCYAFSDDGGKTWKNNAGVEIGRTGEKYITADSLGVSVWKIPTGTRYINGGSLAISGDGTVHVLCRNKDGSPTHYSRDPKSTEWTSEKCRASGELLATAQGEVFSVSESGLWQLAPGNDKHLAKLNSEQKLLFGDCSPEIDAQRYAHDGWASLIGQKGSLISVIDFKLPEEPVAAE
jgi:ribosomal protein L24E